MHEVKYFLQTFGCQMNILDSQLIEGQLRARGMTPVTNYRDADVILFNTCSVRQHAEDKVYSRLGQIQGFKQSRPETVVGVVGCMAERVKLDLFVQAPHLDLLCGPGELNQLPALIEEVRARRAQVAALAGSQSRRTPVLQRALESDSLETLDLSRAPQTEGNVLQSYVRVQRGCDKFCTFCVVPFVRGPERSRPPSHIVQEARTLADRGCREVTLLGQTVNSYVHQENGQAVTFAKLLERVHEVDGIDRLRFVTSFPADWDEDIFRVMRDHPRLMPQLHIPAQSGSGRILKAMRRTYTADSYLKLLDTARKYVPHIALAGDFIVGFCGETEEDFRQSVDLVRRVQYESLFIFKYSPRPGTKADRNLADDVPHAVKVRRNNELLAVQDEISLRHKQALIGQTVEVLVEGFSKAARKAQGEPSSQLRTRGKASPTFGVGASGDRTQQAGRSGPQTRQDDQPTQTGRAGSTRRPAADRSAIQLVGRTPGDLLAVFDAPPELIGAIVNVRVEGASPHTLFGHVTEVVSPPRARSASQPQRRDDCVSLPILPA
ncbi:MAG: tRNA (N6-isopentenyl adenosine(37)-C2)-methylthiotransferase MiaB [Phycisphaerae bacterium]